MPAVRWIKFIRCCLILCCSVPWDPQDLWWRVAGQTATKDVGYEDQSRPGLIGQMGLREGPVEVKRLRLRWQSLDLSPLWSRCLLSQCHSECWSKCSKDGAYPPSTPLWGGVPTCATCVSSLSFNNEAFCQADISPSCCNPTVINLVIASLSLSNTFLIQSKLGSAVYLHHLQATTWSSYQFIIDI